MEKCSRLSDLNSTTQSPSLKDEHWNLISDPVITANLFNTHFCNIHQAVAVDKSITPSDSNINTLKTNLLNIEVSYTYCDSKVCLKPVKTLDTSKTTKGHTIHSKYLKLSAIIIAPIITYVFNCSIN